MTDLENLERRLTRRCSKQPSGCILWGGYKGPTGYGAIGHLGKVIRAHRAAWLVYKGPIPHGMSICHSCDNPACVFIGHLFLGTHAENMADMERKGRSNAANAIAASVKAPHKYGEDHHATKLNTESVTEMRRLRASGETLKALSIRFSTPIPTVQCIVVGKTWKNLPGATSITARTKGNQQ